MIKLDLVTKEGTREVIKLAHIIWNQHYPGIISQKQIDFMLEEMYSPNSLCDQIDNKHQFYLIKEEDKAIGFLSYNKIEDTESEYFLNKFYLDQNLSGKGVGTVALHMLIRMLTPSFFRLTVNRQNYKSINFYFKNGFKIESVKDLDIGNGYFMNDFVMVWEKKDVK